MILTLLTAYAAPTVEVGATSLYATGNIHRRGIQTGVDASVRASPIFGVSASVWGQSAFTPGVSQWIPRAQPDGTLTRVRGAGTLLADFSPVSGTVVDRPFWIDLGVGPAIVHTLDDAVALQCDADCGGTARQWHPAIAWAVGPRVALSDRAGLRLQARGQHWVETLEGVNLQRMNQVALGAGLTVRLGPVEPAPSAVTEP